MKSIPPRVLLLLSFVTAAIYYLGASSSQSSDPDSLRVRALELVADDGQVLAALGSENNAAYLILRQYRGEARIELSVTPEGIAAMKHYDKTGAIVLQSLADAESVLLSARNQTGETSATVAIYDDGGAYLGLEGRDSSFRAECGGESSRGLLFFGPEQSSVRISFVNDMPRLSLVGRTGVESAAIGADKSGDMRIWLKQTSGYAELPVR